MIFFRFMIFKLLLILLKKNVQNKFKYVFVDDADEITPSLFNYLKYIKRAKEDRANSIYVTTGGLAHNILEKFYTNEIPYEKMRQIRKGLQEGIDLFDHLLHFHILIYGQFRRIDTADFNFVVKHFVMLRFVFTGGLYYRLVTKLYPIRQIKIQEFFTSAVRSGSRRMRLRLPNR